MNPDETPSPCERLAALLAHGIDDKPADFVRFQGVVHFQVEGDRSLCLRFGDPDTPLAWGDTEEPSLRLRTDRAGIEALLEPDFDPAAALAAGTLALEGDLDLVGALVHIMTPGQSAVDLRASR